MPVAGTVQSSSNQARQLSDGNDQGTTFGLAGTTAQGAADQIGFFGKVAPQQSGNAQAAVPRGTASGQILSFQSVQSGTSVQAATTSEFTMTLIGGTGANPVQSGDLIYVNKPTAQAGLGVGNARASGVNTIGVTFSNNTPTTIVPTANQGWGAIAIRGFNTLTATLSPAAVQPLSTTEQLFTVTGLRTGELVQVNKPSQQAGLDIVGCRVAANNQVGITFLNNTTATITPTAAESYAIFSSGGIASHTNEVIFQITASPTSIVGLGGTTEYAMPVTGLAIGDVVKGISKPSSQAGLGIVGMRVSVPSTIGVTFMNSTAATVQPTAGEVYEIALTRPNPVGPLLIYTQALTPTSVPANSTLEQTFTVTGLIASTPVWVNKPSAQAGLGIAGVRVSATNTLAINFSNTSTASITPTAAEVYVIGNFQDALQTGGVNALALGNSLMRHAVTEVNQSAILTNAERAALTTTGLIAGA